MTKTRLIFIAEFICYIIQSSADNSDIYAIGVNELRVC
jgi:hypothetical protein